MTSVLIGIALKSLLLAGATLALLALLRRRSASERSWVAHIGLFSLVVLAFAPLALPSWRVEAPALLGQAPSTDLPSSAAPASPVAKPSPLPVAATPVTRSTPSTKAPQASISAAAAATALYSVPAALLLIVTLLAIFRLVALRARAEVLVDAHWLSALARAQRRMGFKHGTALLTSNDLASPISWGLMRPVILLNTRAVAASDEAEAIIAHELAHVARMDWIKLLLARLATALFWFNPLVWVLAREAHQLREEAADDAVLGADICDTDYAQLLVGVARHECPGLLLGAHGVAPSKGSLARRVARVLDAGSARAPAARPFALGVLAGASLVAAPLAALTLTPGNAPASPSSAAAAKNAPHAKTYYYQPAPPADLPHIIASGVRTAVAAVGPATAMIPAQLAYTDDARDAAQEARDAAEEQRDRARELIEAQREQARDAADQARDQIREAREQAREAARASGGRDDIDDLIEAKAVGVTPDYVAAMRAVVPSLRNARPSGFVGLKSVGVTPDYAREMITAFGNLGPDALTEARSVGLQGSYIRAMAAAGIRANFNQYVELWTVGVKPEFVQQVRRAGYSTSDPDKLVQLQALGINLDRYRLPPPAPPAPPRPPKVPPRNWNPITNPDGDGG